MSRQAVGIRDREQGPMRTAASHGCMLVMSEPDLVAAVAENPNTPEPTLAELLSNVDHDIRGRAVANPSLPEGYRLLNKVIT